MFLFRYGTFQNVFREKKYERQFNPIDRYRRQYFDEDDFIAKNGNEDQFLNVFKLNIAVRSLPRNGG